MLLLQGFLFSIAGNKIMAKLDFCHFGIIFLSMMVYSKEKRQHGTWWQKPLFLLLSLTLLVFITSCSGEMMGVETPKYTVIEKRGDVERRSYDRMILAQTTVQGPRDEAISAGFRVLADYIFGNNERGEEISMTAPVIQQPDTKAVSDIEGEKSWVVSFVAPSSYDLNALPKPASANVTFTEVRDMQVVALTFSGSQNAENLQKHMAQLLDYVGAQNLKTVGQPFYAFYDPPWTPSFLRRNEVMIALDPNS